MGFSFNSLDLSGATVSSGGGLLKPGRYIARITEASISNTQAGGHKLDLKFSAIDGSGSIKHSINVNVPKSAKATEIGKSQLKTMLYYGGHPNPDRPSDVNTIRGLVVGISVKGTQYVKDGQTRDSSEVGFVFDPAELDNVNYVAKPKPAAKAAGGAFSGPSSFNTAPANNMNDDIPF